MPEQGNILVIDDEPGVRSALDGILRDEGFEVTVAGSGEEGLEAVADGSFDAILLDVWLPGIDGLETLTKIREGKTDAEVVMISGHGTIETAVRATKLGAFDFIEKPLSLDRTLLVLRNALRQRRLFRANARLMQQLQRDTEILGESASSEALRRGVEDAAAGDAPVTIVGPQGSGRENVARRIHGQSARFDRPFVEMPFGAMSPERAHRLLLDDGDRPGRLNLAQAGTLFLEDVDRLPLEDQQRIAAMLVDRARQPDAPRWLASVRSEQNLDPDLSQVLEVIRIEIPPLARRKEDLPALTERFLREFSREYGKDPVRLGPAAWAAMRAYDWPGDVSELRNLVENWSATRSGEEIGPELVPGTAPGSGAAPTSDLYGDFENLDSGLTAFRRFHIGKALQAAKGEISSAAKALGISEEQLKAGR